MTAAALLARIALVALCAALLWLMATIMGATCYGAPAPIRAWIAPRDTVCYVERWRCFCLQYWIVARKYGHDRDTLETGMASWAPAKVDSGGRMYRTGRYRVIER